MKAINRYCVVSAHFGPEFVPSIKEAEKLVQENDLKVLILMAEEQDLIWVCQPMNQFIEFFVIGGDEPGIPILELPGDLDDSEKRRKANQYLHPLGFQVCILDAENLCITTPLDATNRIEIQIDLQVNGNAEFNPDIQSPESIIETALDRYRSHHRSSLRNEDS